MAKELINDSALTRLYQNVLEEDAVGNEVELKMQATKEFKVALNEFAFQAISACISHARAAKRLTLHPRDIPTLVEAPPDPEAEPLEPEITIID
jgi:histone H3/H4